MPPDIHMAAGVRSGAPAAQALGLQLLGFYPSEPITARRGGDPAAILSVAVRSIGSPVHRIPVR
ncbi:hypothetical protein [Azorhizobium doebereinerae]|uniref:hypothetical protein n=1 Tax=Azorhizobium doebereinerae TaxID=281091 RepID=UPI0003F55D7F|nr:hypothetical protein [Azorhizobium doebereinerae]